MPVYEFQCRSCGAVTEHLVGVGNDEAEPRCDCGSTELRRMISLVSVNRGAAPEPCCGGHGSCDGQGSGACACGA